MIFLDMDGVLADFDKGFQDRFGIHPSKYKEGNKKGMWELIHSVPDFFSTLPEVEGAMEFMDWLEDWLGDWTDSPVVLTACPYSKYHEVAKQKKEWIFKRWQMMVLPAYGSESKPAYIQNIGDILIDDWGKNCEAWEAGGGRAIKFDGDWKYIKEQLREHYTFV